MPDGARARSGGDPAGIMPGGQGRGAEIPGYTEQIAEFDSLIAADARDRCLAAGVAVDKIVDDRSPEAGLVIEHIMGDAEALGDPRSIVDVASGTAGAAAPCRSAMVVELQRDADDFKPALDQQGRGHRRVDPAGHRDDHSVAGRLARQIKFWEAHDCAFNPSCQKSASSRAAAAKTPAREEKRPSPPRRANCSSSAAAASRASSW